MRTLFFRVNGMTRNIEIQDKSLNIKRIEHQKAEKDNPLQMSAPLQGMLSKVLVKVGDKVVKNQPLYIIEAMKMETTVTAPYDAIIQGITLTDGTLVEAEDLVLSFGQ
jgi:pyruvate carboxylase